MKTFIKKTLLFILPILLLATVGEVLLRKIPNDYTLKRDYIKEHSKEIELLILGSSHSTYGVNPEYFSSENLKTKSFNASNISQTIDYDYEIFKKYGKDLTGLKYIILPISYFSLYIILDSGDELWRVKNYNIYYGMKKSSNITDYFEILSSEMLTNLKRLYNYYRFGMSHVTCSKYGWRMEFHSKLGVDFLESGKAAAERHSGKGENHLVENSKMLREIIEIANQRGVKILLYTPPAYHTYVDNLDSAQLNTTIDYVKGLPNIYKNTSYINLLSDKDFTKEDFYDADHLNKFGAMKLTKILEEAIKKL